MAVTHSFQLVLCVAQLLAGGFQLAHSDVALTCSDFKHLHISSHKSTLLHSQAMGVTSVQHHMLAVGHDAV